MYAFGNLFFILNLDLGIISMARATNKSKKHVE